METSTRKITGYRDLSQAEIDLMNEIKAKGEELGVLIAAMKAGVRLSTVTAFKKQGEADDANFDQADAEYQAQLIVSEETLRWIRIAEDHLQQGMMALTRAVARPTTF